MKLKFKMLSGIHTTIILACMGLVFIQGCNAVFQQMSPQDLHTLEDTCSNLPRPDFFTKVKEYSIVKPEAATFSVNYRSSTLPAEVREFYSNVLIPQGWKYAFYSDGGTNQIDFRKGKYSVVIQYQDFSLTDDKLYMVSCSWGISRNGIMGDLFKSENQ